MRRNGYTTRTARKGFSIIELLIALIIIGILAAILIPLIANRSQKARIAAAESDIERLAVGMDSVAVDTGYYPRLFMLNDSSGPDRDGMLQTDGSGYGDDTNRQYSNPGGSPVVQGVNQLFFFTAYPRVGVLVDASTGSELRSRLTTNETDFNWNGSYVNWGRDADSTTGLPDGIPDDPWGNNYLLIVPSGETPGSTPQLAGIVIEPDGTVDANPTINGVGVTNGGDFDRPTLVSLGPDGVPGSVGSLGDICTGDDIFREFGP